MQIATAIVQTQSDISRMISNLGELTSVASLNNSQWLHVTDEMKLTPGQTSSQYLTPG